MRKITVTDVDKNFVVNELNLFFAQTMIAHAFVDVDLCRRER